MAPPTSQLFPPFRLVPSQRQLLRADVPVKLGARAFDVLVALVERRERTVSKDELLQLAWPGLVVEENNLQVQIGTLRKLLGHPAITTIPGRGYRFTVPVTADGGGAPEPVAADARPEPAGGGNLPAESLALIGRGDDLAHLLALLEGRGLVTVAGPAGIGKTRLAQAAAARRAPCTPDGAWWVDLASLADDARVADAAAIALGLGLAGATDATLTVIAALRERAPLIVLDNAEHLLPGVVDFVTRLRAAVPGAGVLVTSQEPLRIDGELVFRPEPLSLPDGDAPERVDASGAVNLFVARARAADRTFELHAGNRALVAEVCRRLDGIPLAIELAAARLPLLGVEGLRDMLDERLRVLTTGHRTALQRHQTLRSALEWSHHLLSADEQAVFRRLAVFAGGFTLQAAQQVAEDDDGIDRWDVLEHLGALVDKSLVVAEGEALPRYRLLETTRLFALERLVDSGETAAVRARHRDHFLFVAESSRQGLLGAELGHAIARLDLERDNLIAALAWGPSADDAQPGLRLAAATHYYWFFRALPRRGLEVARAALDRPGAQAPTIDRCRVLAMAGWLGASVGQVAQVQAWLDEALRLARDLGDDRALCHALTKYAHFRQDRGQDSMALPLAIEALAVGRRLGDGIELGEALMQRAHAHLRAREREQARGLFEEALALRRRIGNTSGVVSTCTSLAQAALEDDRAPAARPYLDEALALMPMVDSQIAGLHCVALVGEWAAAIGQPETAVLLEAAHDRLSAQAGLAECPEVSRQQRLAGARASLDGATLARVQEAGRALGGEAALQAARAFVDRMSAPR